MPMSSLPPKATPAAAQGQVVSVVIDRAMYNARVWINGHDLGARPFGYIEFRYDISRYLRVDRPNVMAVRRTPEDLSPRWDPGAGLYRHVWMDYRDPLHVAPWGTRITTPAVVPEQACIAGRAELNVVSAHPAMEVS